MIKLENNGAVIKEQKHKLAAAVDALEKNKDFSQARIIVDVDPV
jgi:hypothetical protein